MARAGKTLVSAETDVWWVLGTRPGGPYYNRDRPDGAPGLGDATPFETEGMARQALCFARRPPAAPAGRGFRVIRVLRTTRESCDG